MTRRQRLTDDGVAKLKVTGKRHTVADPELPGHYVRVSATGSKAFVCVTRDASGKQKWRQIGEPPMSIDDARDIARKFIRSMRASTADSFAGVASAWFEREVVKKAFRTRPAIERILKNQILPVFGEREFTSIRRLDVAQLLDSIEDNSGPRAADYALSIIHSICKWHSLRDEHYVMPIVRKMTRYDRKANERDRILDDDEIRAVWNAAEGNYGRLVRFALLTAQRHEKCAAMRWEHVEGNAWTIPGEDREKGTGGVLILPPLAMGILGKRGTGLIFPTPWGKEFSNGRDKRKLDKLSGVTEPWRFHDLRRTARSLMSRAGVRPDIAERVLGHTLTGVERVYDRHSYEAEKGHALKALASLVENILRPASGKVRRLRG